MAELLQVRSIAFIDGIENRDEIVIPQRLFEQWMDFFEHGKPMLAKLQYQDLERIVCIGSGHADNYIYAPQWIISHLGSSANDELLISVEPFMEPLPAAEKIMIRVYDSVDETLDLRQAIETHLDCFHVLESNTTLVVPLENGYPLCVYIEGIEPTNRVRLGGEVILEFLEEPEPEPESEPEPEPESEPAPAPAHQPSTSMTADQKEAMRLARIKRFATHSN